MFQYYNYYNNILQKKIKYFYQLSFIIFSLSLFNYSIVNYNVVRLSYRILYT